MKQNILLFAVAACLTTQAHAKEIGFIEDFSLATERTEALQQLIPGTEQYYYYHALHYQNLEQFDRVDELLKAWIKRYKHTALNREIMHRQALLTYDRHPQESLGYIRKQLGLRFNHQRERLGVKPNLPVSLDQNLIGRQRLLQRALRRYKNLKGFEDVALDWLVAADLDPARRRHLLERLQRPDYSTFSRLVVDDLNYRHSKGFGSFAIHRQLLLSQLDECLELKSDLLNQTNFVQAYLAKLQPNPDVDWRHDAEEHEAYLDRLWLFVGRLAPVHNSLKSHVAYHRLVFDRSRGMYDKERFLTYIQLPRPVSYINADYMKMERNRRHPCDLNHDFSSLTLLPPVGNDEPLVRSYLHHFFLTENTTRPYERYINDIYLKHSFAELKITAGLGDPERWYSMLPPDKYQELKERVDLDFSYTNQRVFTANQPVALDMSIKNVETLLVKVYKINTKNYYRQHRSEVNTDMNLDGLVANIEETYEFTEPPLRRVARHFDFSQLNDPGVYVIDFIGNGRSSRVVVRKGRLRYLVRTGTVGHVFTVLDEDNDLVSNASLWMEGHEYHANDQGKIATPFSNQPGRQPIVLSQGDFSSLAFFQHQAENYQLRAGIFVDRESLLSRQKARIVVRPGLYLNNTPVTLSVLKEPELVITSTDHDGVATTKEVKDFKLYENRESTYQFQVPARLAQINFTLKAKVQNRSRNEKVNLAVSESFLLNEIDKTDKVETLLLMKSNGSYVTELLGRTGEPRSDRAIRLSLKHRDFRNPVQVSLKTNERGRVILGPLKDIASVTATGPQETSQTWRLLHDDHTYLGARHATVGETIELPYLNSPVTSTHNKITPQREELSLLELRGNTFVTDHFGALTIRNGLLRIKNLQPGDYDLLLKRSGRHIRLRVSDGVKRAGYILGKGRHLEVRGRRPLQIESVQTTNKNIRVQLANSTKFTRVHVFATVYQQAFPAFQYLARVGNIEPLWLSVPKLETLYAQGRNIGDEYRYILERRYATRFPGNMLERPSLLLNPWAVRSTETGQQEAAAGDSFSGADEPSDSAPEPGKDQSFSQKASGEFANLDFLTDSSAVLVNRVPDEDGVLVLARDEVGRHQQLHIVAVDPRNTTYRQVSLVETERQPQDLRLIDGLDPDRHFTQQKQVTVVRAEQSFQLDDIVTARFEAYDTLPKVYALYLTLSSDPKLIEFGFLLNWPEMSQEAKREKYSEYACHELNFFIYKKDPEFFAGVVRPYLENKLNKTFLDRWLVGENLEEYLQPWRHDRLNIVERILLAERLVGEQQYTLQHVRDKFHLLPPDVDRFILLFNTAIQGSALDADVDQFDAAKKAEAQQRIQLGATEMRLFAESAGGGKFKEAIREDESTVEEFTANLVPNRGRLYFDADGAMTADFRQYYRKLEKTQEWVENNYYKLPSEQQNSELITTNAFWTDFVGRQAEQPFFSPHLAEASRNFPEIMFALSVLDIPFRAEEHDSQFAAAKMTLTAVTPIIMFHEDIRQADAAAEQQPILVSQNFFRHGDRYRHENNQQYDKFVTDEFLAGVVYGCQIVVTNPTSSPKKLDVLLQVPVGAIPVMNGQYTKSAHIDLDSFHTKTIEYYFYFPEPGRFPHYPVQVASNEKLLASAVPFTFHVVDALSKIDKQSWDYFSQHGSQAEVIEYLQQANLYRTKLDRIAWRLHDREFFAQVIALLGERHAYDQTLWSYSIKHNAVPAIREFLQHAEQLVNQCGESLDSPLLVIDPVVRQTYEQRDYKPLVNARAHQLGQRRQILNLRFYEQYHHLLKILSYRRQLTDDDRMAVTYYMLLQDRVQEALDSFAGVNPERLQTQVQYDYFTAYLNFYGEDQLLARDLTDRYGEYPVDHWRKAFVAIDSQLDEIAGDAGELVDDKDRTQRQAQLAATEANFELEVDAGKVRIDYQNISSVRVNYYLMDIELMFSTTPFVRDHGDSFSYIYPNSTQLVELSADEHVVEFALPDELHNRNVLVEIEAAGQTKTQAYFAHALTVQAIENYGQLRVTHKESRKPLSKVYVKVYARMQDGQIRFYKDGYTDLRGRFDYTSLNTNELDFVQTFSLLVLSDEHGAVIREVNPPKQ